MVSHVDVPPPRKDEVIAALNPLAEQSRKGPGNLRFDVWQQTSRPNHFTVVEAWKDQKAYDARGSAPPQRTFRDKLGPMLGALYESGFFTRSIDGAGTALRDQRPYFSRTARQGGLNSRRRAWKQRRTARRCR